MNIPSCSTNAYVDFNIRHDYNFSEYTYYDLNRKHKLICKYCKCKQDSDNDRCAYCGAPMPLDDNER
jgi:rRNA maturation endonuclease Nob1